VLSETGHDTVESRTGLAIRNAPDPEFLYRFNDFHFHGVVAGDAAGAAHLAVVNDVEEPV
jgi:hypothetical protein